MTVFDASVVVDALTNAARPGEAARGLLHTASQVDAPAILRAEVTSALRAQLRRGEISSAVARNARGDLARIRIVEHSFAPFAERIWDLRDNLTVYDAWYAALAEELSTPLVTGDRRIRGAPDLRCEVVLV